MEVKIRKALNTDCHNIIKLQNQWAEENITYGFQPETIDTIKGKINNIFYVAEYESEIVGFLTASIHEAKDMAVMKNGERYIEIEDIYVSSQYRDKGVGSRLMERALSEADEQGISRALVYSAAKDLDSVVAFYRRHGFKSWYVEMFK